MKIKKIDQFSNYRNRIKKRREYKRLTKILGIKPLKGNKVDYYDDGDIAYDEMLKAISEAEKNINLGTYIFNDDYVGNIFKDHLIKKANQGVKIKII
jgi:cardiolipin synthase